jgi:5-formyltetrahydrofolate cyclo-ligase
MAWRSEVDTTNLIEHLLRQEQRVVLPLVDFQEHLLQHYYIQSLNDVIAGAFGIREPDVRVCVRAKTSDLDIVIVPGVAFDRRGHRLGSGHGYYDRFLAEIESLRVGLAFGAQIVDEVPVNDYDQAMDFIVTEGEIISCGAS